MADIRQCKELWKELQFLFHGHRSNVKGLGAFMSIVARLPTVETYDHWVALSMHVINIHQSGTIFWRWGAEALCRGRWSEAWKHFPHQSECCFGLGWRRSRAYGVVHHIPVHFYKGFVCPSVLGHLACGLIHPLGSSKSGAPSLSSVTWFWSAGSSLCQNLMTIVLSSSYSSRSVSSWKWSM